MREKLFFFTPHNDVQVLKVMVCHMFPISSDFDPKNLGQKVRDKKPTP